MYKPGGTIATALGRIQHTGYVLPAIQREFVWKPEQIERLFDSLMQGYPFGTFLFWKVEPSTSGKFKFYDFVLNYHQRSGSSQAPSPKTSVSFSLFTIGSRPASKSRYAKPSCG